VHAYAIGSDDDYRTGQILDAIHDAGIEDNNIVVFASDNGRRRPTHGRATAVRGAVRTSPRWKLLCALHSSFAGRERSLPVESPMRSCTSSICTRHWLASLARKFPPIALLTGIDQLNFFLGKQENSNREGFPAYVVDRLQAVKWHNW
jgi:hypothetical protein